MAKITDLAGPAGSRSFVSLVRKLVLLVLVCGLTACDGDSANDGAPLSLEDLPGRFAVGQRTDVLLYDDARDREVTATFWYPSAGPNRGPEVTDEGADLVGGNRKFPLLVLIHGIVDDAPGTWPYLAPHLASHGYIVAAPSTGSNFTNTSDLANHPGDVSFLIDTISGANQLDDMFLQRTDLDKIAVGGFSFGGAATYLLAYDSALRDPRIKAAIIMAGISGGAPPVNPGMSLLAIFGTEDPLIPHAVGVGLYEEASAPKYLVTFLGGGHLGFTRSDETFDGATMDQSRQESLTRLVLLAYLTSLFSGSAEDRAVATEYLEQGFPESNSDVEVRYQHD